MVKIIVFDTETSGLPEVKPWEIPSTIPITFDCRGNIKTNFKPNKEILNLSDSEIISYRANKILETELFYNSLHKEYNLSTELWKHYINKWPYIVQLSYILYDTDTYETNITSNYINIPENIILDPKSSAITHIYKNEKVIPMGIDKNKCIILSDPNLNKIFIKDALINFIDHLKSANYVVGHNILFDRNMIIAELIRNNFNKEDISIFMDNLNVKYICTMKETKMLCMLPNVKQYINNEPIYHEIDINKPETIKMPKLTESYRKIFGYMPEANALHNSLYDVVITLRIFCMLGKYFDNIDVYGTNSALDKLLDDITNDPNYKININLQNLTDYMDKIFYCNTTNIKYNIKNNKNKKSKKSIKNNKYKRNNKYSTKKIIN